ncbi:TRAP transporter substrate-binding protein DctP [Stutzerimonas nitrititolerans]|uniref:TRAP transporter substrate-binding protein DctP n=1 Tax=Stutzerimonas nitrititolerans TaxID=2482751 RepID=UPI0028971D9D|nr:TRAP transporter substrate-binding protein DctP [Stutzerimonas nitrititolerans]
MQTLRKIFAIGATVAGLAASSIPAAFAADTTLRMTHLFRAESDAGRAAQAFADEINTRSDGRIKINVYPSSQLGDWTETHGLLMQGAIDIGLQPLSTNFNRSMAIAWFPYIAPTYAEAKVAYSRGGFASDIADELMQKQGLRLLGVFGDGMGGAGFTKDVSNPATPGEDKKLRIRVWPGGTTHRVLMEKMGYQVATVPWAELYTGMQTGVVDGQVGGSPEMTYTNFKDITKTWVQYNDHLELAWFVMNAQRLASLPEADQQLLVDVAQEISSKRFDEVEAADERQLQALEAAGTKVVRLTPEQLEQMASFTRETVWPQIAGELGDDVMDKLREGLQLD